MVVSFAASNRLSYAGVEGCWWVDRGGEGVVEVAPGDSSRISSREGVLPILLQKARALYLR